MATGRAAAAVTKPEHLPGRGSNEAAAPAGKDGEMDDDKLILGTIETNKLYPTCATVRSCQLTSIAPPTICIT